MTRHELPFAYGPISKQLRWTDDPGAPRLALDLGGVRVLTQSWAGLTAGLDPSAADVYLGLGTSPSDLATGRVYRDSIVADIARRHPHVWTDAPTDSDRSMIAGLAAAGIVTLRVNPFLGAPADPLEPPDAYLVQNDVGMDTPVPLQPDGTSWRFCMRLDEGTRVFADTRRALVASLMPSNPVAHRYLGLDRDDPADWAEGWLMRHSLAESLCSDLGERVRLVTTMPPYRGRRKAPRRSYDVLLDPDSDVHILETLGFTGRVMISVNPDRLESLDLNSRDLCE